MENNELYQKAIEKWGLEAQFNMAVEECAELIVEIQHNKRNRNSLVNIIEEAVDVYNCVKQIRTLDPELFDYKEKEKMERLKDRLYG